MFQKNIRTTNQVRVEKKKTLLFQIEKSLDLTDKRQMGKKK